MAEDMPLSSSSSSWKYLSSASSRITSLKGYIANHQHQHYIYRESTASSGTSSSFSTTSSMSYSSTSSSAMGAGAGSGSRFSAGRQYSPNDIPQYGSTSTSTQSGSSSGYPQQHQHHQPPQLQQHQPPPHQHQSAPRQSWRAWAGQKIRAHAAKRGYGVGGSGNRNGGAGPASSNTEVVNVFPGWAVRRYRPLEQGEDNNNNKGPRPFDLEVFISGYAITHRAPENMSRAQRGFLRLAKGFASLPKIIDTPQPSSSSPTPLSQVKLTPSTEALLASITLPPRPTEISDDFDVDALDRQLRKAKEGVSRDWKKEQEEEDESESSSSSTSARGSTVDLRAQSQRTQGSAPAPGFPPGEPPANPSPHNPAEATQEMIRRLHANLEKRLQPFWASVLAGRGVRVLVYPLPHSSPSTSSGGASSSPPSSSSSSSTQDINLHELLSEEAGPLASAELQTAADGSFQVRLRVTWEELCLHPRALHIAFREPTTTSTKQGQGQEFGEEDEVVVLVELLGAKESGGSAYSSPSSSRLSLSQPDSSSQPQAQPTPSIPSIPSTLTTTRIPLTHTPTIRAISDIDDTIKLSGILSGARAVFHNVFVKDLKESVIPGMGEWYVGMWVRGVRFHYVSNGPFELLPVLNEFLEISQLPPGSIKLRSYAGRSLFNGLLSAPAARKRAGVTDILDAFPESKFFLIGDSGEQDMELYADIARERPHQILAIYIRDADAFTYNGPEPLEDPTGWKAIASGDAGTRPSGKPLVHAHTHPHAPQATRSDSMMTTSSSASGSTTSSNLDRYDYGAVGETPSRESWRSSLVGVSRQNSDFETPLEPPRPQFWSESSGNGNGNGRQGYAMGGRGAMSAEPEPLIDLSDCPEEAANATPRTSSSARMDSPHVNAERQETATPTQRHSARFQSQSPSQGQGQRQYVTEPPPPTPPPSSNTTFPYSHSHSNSQTHPYRSHHPSSSTSSLSSSASTSTTNLSKHQYGYFSGNSQAASATTNSNTNPSPSPTKKGSTSSGSTSGMTENEKKRHELQLRVWRARTQIPPEVMLRVFRDPIAECVGEAAEVLDREGM